MSPGVICISIMFGFAGGVFGSLLAHATLLWWEGRKWR